MNALSQSLEEAAETPKTEPQPEVEAPVAVGSTCRDLVPFEGQLDIADFGLLAELHQLEDQTAELEKEREVILQESMVICGRLEKTPQNAIILLEIKEIEEESASLLEEILKLKAELEADGATVDLPKGIDPKDSIKEEERKEKLKHNEAVELRKLYRYLRKRCHPDHTSNVFMHDLFLAVEKAYEKNSLVLMKECMAEYKVLDEASHDREKHERFKAMMLYQAKNRKLKAKQALEDYKTNSIGGQVLDSMARGQVNEARAFIRQLLDLSRAKKKTQLLSQKEIVAEMRLALRMRSVSKIIEDI